MKNSRSRVIVTGGTGYVGGRLIGVLSKRHYHLRCMARRPEYLQGRFSPDVEIVRGDVLKKETLAKALDGGDAAYYLIHSMGDGNEFELMERTGAENFGAAAARAGVSTIIYLGGLGSGEDLSPHLSSRQEVGRILHASGVPVVELRASVVIGSGSLSFEMIRALVERLPVMITPRWVSTESQPIAVTDLLDYLVGSLELKSNGHTILEIGGADRMSYGELMKEYARQRGLRRLMIPVPVLSPRLSSLWLGLVTPLYARTGRKLVESLRHPTVVRDRSAETAFTIRPRTLRRSIEEALRNEDQEFAETRWSDSLAAAGKRSGFGGARVGNRLMDQRRQACRADAERVFGVIKSIGGKKGWFFGNRLWQLRGFIDLLVGGVGIRRGRRDPASVRVGDVIDWWRVESFEEGKLLRLEAEMRLPGRAWLEFTVERDGEQSRVTQTALFDPVGLAGVAYWYLVYPLHVLVFRGMLDGIAREAERLGE